MSPCTSLQPHYHSTSCHTSTLGTEAAESRSQTTCQGSPTFGFDLLLSLKHTPLRSGWWPLLSSQQPYSCQSQVFAHWVSPCHTEGLTLPCDNPNPTYPSSLHRNLFCPFQNTFISPSSETFTSLKTSLGFFFFNLFNYNLMMIFV